MLVAFLLRLLSPPCSRMLCEGSKASATTPSTAGAQLTVNHKVVILAEWGKVATESPVEHLAEVGVLRLKRSDGKEDDVANSDWVVEAGD